MAPTNNHVQHFKLCNSTNTLGNTIAVLLLDYFGMSGLQNNRLEALTLAFLETSRMLFRLRNAMSENKATPARKRPSIDGSDRFLEHLRLAYVTFTGLHQYLSNKLKIERKHGFSKLGHSLRTICHGTDAERLRAALEQCHGGLQLAAATFSPASLTDVRDITGAFGYTALLAVFASRMKPLPAPPSPPPVIPTPLTRRETPLDHLCAHDGSQVTGDSDTFRSAIANSAFDIFGSCHSKPQNLPPSEGDYDGSVLLRSSHSRRYKDDKSLMPGRSARRNVEVMSTATNISPVELPAHRGAIRTRDHDEASFSTSHSEMKDDSQGDVMLENGNTPLIHALEWMADTESLERMLRSGTDPNRKNRRGETPLFKAIHTERFDLIAMLLDYGANPNLPGPKHVLWPAVHQPKVLEILLLNGAQLSLTPGIVELATSINSLEAINILLRHGADPNAKKDGIYTPLCSAIRDDRGHLVDVLLAAGASPDVAALDYPAFKCVSYHRPYLLPKLLDAGAKVGSPEGIIEACVEHNDKDCLELLLQYGADVNARASSGRTALTTAIKTNNLVLIDVLLEHGADPAVRGQEWPINLAVESPEVLSKLLPHISTERINKGALERAVMANQIESVKLLLAKGVDVEDKNGGVFSALTTSIREDRKEIFHYLLDEARADPNAPGEHLPIIKAIRRHRADDLSYIQHLIKCGADINSLYRGWNAVLQALDNGETQVFRVLAESGSPDLSVEDENGQSVLAILRERGMKDELRILLSGSKSASAEIRSALGQLRDLVKD
jgi:ankyrin repeat protein